MGDAVPVAGSMVGAYRLDAVIGTGGMGAVWAAVHVPSGAAVALKLWKPSGTDADLRARVLREARAARAVQHPHVVTVLDVIELDDGAPAIAMERLVGESLEARLRQVPRLALAEVADLLAPVVSAVGAAHAVGVVHRDLKPANIFLCDRAGGVRIAKVLDFGIAKVTALDGESARSLHGTTGVVQGTPMYMAPEQVYAEPDVDHRADVWALGLVLYQCLSGVLPTRAENNGQVFKNVTAKEFAPLGELVEVPDEVARLVMRMLERERAHRVEDLREVRDVLAGYASEAAARAAVAFEAPRIVERRDAVAATLPTSGRRPAAVVIAPKRSRRRAIAAAAGLAALGVVAAVAWRTAGGPAPPPLLREPSSVLACPIFEASGVDEPAGWLGAATAVMACERARVILGGRPARTLEPAELLGLSRQPLDQMPADPYGDPAARTRTLVAARGRAAAYLDGSVAMRDRDVRVVLELHAPDGALLARAEATARGLPAAVRDAMAPLVDAARIPQAPHLDPSIAPWLGTDEVAPALALLDLTFAIDENSGDLTAECARFDASARAQLGDVGALASWRCAYALGTPAPAAALPPQPRREPLDAAAATRIRVQHLLHDPAHPDDLGDVARLDAFAKREPSSSGRALLAATASCLVQGSDPSGAYDRAIAAVIAEPKLVEGDACNAWEQLVSLAELRGNTSSAARAMQAWAPWNCSAWRTELSATTDRSRALVLARRAYALSPFDVEIVGLFAAELLAAGRRDEARNVAVRIGDGDAPVDRLEQALLLVRIDASEARFGAARDAALALLAPRADDHGFARNARFEAAWRALELAQILGDTRTPDRLVHDVVDGDAAAFDGVLFEVARRWPALCAAASPPVAAHCFDRMRALQPQLAAGNTRETAALAQGAELYARGDLRGAAKAWRPLVSDAGTLASVMPGAMIRAFDASGDAELAEKVETAAMARAAELGGATLAHVTAARRALARGDEATARRLANQVIAAWSVADEDIPALAEMRAIAKR